MADDVQSPPDAAPLIAPALNLLALAQPISQKVQLKEVNLWSAVVSRGVETAAKAMPTLFDQRFGAEYSKKSDSELEVMVTFIWNGKHTDGSDATVEAQFSILYGVADLDSHGNDQLLAFAKTNGAFNAWPYWREFVQSMSARIGMKPVFVPAMTVTALISAYIIYEASLANSSTSSSQT
jgi:preprotein translocase subunit SecB